VEPTGDITYAHLFLGSSIIVASVRPDVRLRPDETVWIKFDQDGLHLFDGITEQAM
jgi:multiple sugar transport system ATP-binding protein